MAKKKLIAVIGATGAQGGGLVRAILNDPTSAFQVRAVTRNPQTPKAQALAACGAEVVAADLDDAESLWRAFDGAYGAFCVTFFWEHFSPQLEITHAQRMATAARAANLEHVIWSTLEDSRQWSPLTDTRIPTLMGSYKVPHMDAKGEADRVFIEAGVPTTFLLTSFFWENFIYLGMGPQRNTDGQLVLTLPLMGAPLAGIAAADIGQCAYALFKQAQVTIDQRIGIAGEHLTGDQMALAFSQAFGETVHFNDIAPARYRNLGFPGATELGNMFQIQAENAPAILKLRNVAATRQLNPRLQTFREWLARHQQQIPR
jgi:uncharacterized protein YbjT (DUF2867 family)